MAFGHVTELPIYISKHTYGHVLVLLSWRLGHPAADDDIVICQNARMNICFCCQADV